MQISSSPRIVVIVLVVDFTGIVAIGDFRIAAHYDTGNTAHMLGTSVGFAAIIRLENLGLTRASPERNSTDSCEFMAHRIILICHDVYDSAHGSIIHRKVTSRDSRFFKYSGTADHTAHTEDIAGELVVFQVHRNGSIPFRMQD